MLRLPQPNRFKERSTAAKDVRASSTLKTSTKDVHHLREFSKDCGRDIVLHDVRLMSIMLAFSETLPGSNNISSNTKPAMAFKAYGVSSSDSKGEEEDSKKRTVWKMVRGQRGGGHPSR